MIICFIYYIEGRGAAGILLWDGFERRWIETILKEI